VGRVRVRVLGDPEDTSRIARVITAALEEAGKPVTHTPHPRQRPTLRLVAGGQRDPGRRSDRDCDE